MYCMWIVEEFERISKLWLLAFRDDFTKANVPYSCFEQSGFTGVCGQPFMMQTPEEIPEGQWQSTNRFTISGDGLITKYVPEWNRT